MSWQAVREIPVPATGLSNQSLITKYNSKCVKSNEQEKVKRKRGKREA